MSAFRFVSSFQTLIDSFSGFSRTFAALLLFGENADETKFPCLNELKEVMAPRHFAECLLSEETRSADVVTDTSARKPNILQNRT